MIKPRAIATDSRPSFLEYVRLSVKAGARSSALALLVFAVAACSESGPAPTAALFVSAGGEYTLEGQLVPAEQLTPRLRELQSKRPGLELTIRTDPRANYQAVGKALQAAQDAGVVHIAVTATK